MVPRVRSIKNYSHQMNSFIQQSGKVGSPQKVRFWLKFKHLISFFSENWNGPHGPYEPLLWDVCPNKLPKNRVFDENSLFGKVTMSQKGEMLFLAKKKNSAKWPNSKAKVLNTPRNIPDPNVTKSNVKTIVLKIIAWKLRSFDKTIANIIAIRSSAGSKPQCSLKRGFQENT